MATANLIEPTSASDGNIPYIGATADDGTGNTLRDAIDRINARLREIYGAQDGSNVVQTPFVDADNIKDGVITEAKLDISNAAVNGYILSWNNTAGQFEWKQEFDGDITSIVAGDGLTGSSLDTDDATLNVGAGTGITVNADDIQITDGGVDTTQLADNAVTADKLADSINSEIALNSAKLTNATHTGDVTGSTALTIANDVVDYDKLAGEFTTSTAIAASEVDFSSAAVFTKTLTGTTTLTFSNVFTGMVKTLVISGDQTLVMTGVTKLNGDYSGTASKNVIQIVSTNGSSEMFATISNVA